MLKEEILVVGGECVVERVFELDLPESIEVVISFSGGVDVQFIHFVEGDPVSKFLYDKVVLFHGFIGVGLVIFEVDVSAFKEFGEHSIPFDGKDTAKIAVLDGDNVSGL